MIKNPLYREPLPPEGRPIGKMQAFYELSLKMQCFIFLKYRERRNRKAIMKFLFINSHTSYKKYERRASELIKEIFKK